MCVIGLSNVLAALLVLDYSLCSCELSQLGLSVKKDRSTTGIKTLRWYKRGKEHNNIWFFGCTSLCSELEMTGCARTFNWLILFLKWSHEWRASDACQPLYFFPATMWNVNERMQAEETFEREGFSLWTHSPLSESHCDTEKLGILIDWISPIPFAEVHTQLEEKNYKLRDWACEFFKEFIFF